VDDDWIKHLQGGDHHLYWLRNATISEENLPTLDGEPEMNRVMVQVGDSIVYTEEILSQLLAKARQYASTEAGAPVKDCAITVPYYWSHAQRQALLDAAHLAGFNVLSLLNQNLAIAVKFMTDRDFEDGPAHVVFYDMGTSDLQVSLYRFESVKGKGKTKWVNNATLLATASDDALGGSAFDSAIVQTWVEKLKEKFGVDFVLPPQAMTKLQKQAKKTKEILSANKESHVVIESLLADFDFRASLTREDFERRTEKLVERALRPLKSVLDAAGLSPQQIDLFEMFGGGARIPKIQDSLKAYINPVQLSRHLNTDEAAAFGAAIFAASKSSQHRVKDFNAKDGSNAQYPIMVRATDAAGKPLVEDTTTTDGDGQSESSLDRVLYKETSRLGSRRTLKIKTDKEIYVELKYPNTVQLDDGVSHLIARYKISFPKDLYSRYNVTDTPTAHIRFELTSSGTVLLTSADAQVPIVTQKIVKVKTEVIKESSDTEASNNGVDVELEDIPSSTTTTTTTTTTEETTGQDDVSSTFESETVETENSIPSSTDSESIESIESNDNDDDEIKSVLEEITEIRQVHSLHTVKMTLDTLASIGLSPTQLSDAKRRLKILDDEERIRLETEHAKSDLEALIYGIYDKLEDSEIVKFSTSEERSTISDVLGVDSVWLEEDGAEATKADYLEKKSNLNKLWTKITLRISESKELPIAVDKCHISIFAAREALNKIQETRNVTAADIDPVKESIDKVEEFITSALKEETDRPLHEDPKTLSSQVSGRCREFSWRIDFLSKKPRKSKPVEPKQNNTTNTEPNTPPASTESNESQNDAKSDQSTSESTQQAPKDEL
jgi:hypoxia up-regulated 1